MAFANRLVSYNVIGWELQRHRDGTAPVSAAQQQLAALGMDDMPNMRQECLEMRMQLLQTQVEAEDKVVVLSRGKLTMQSGETDNGVSRRAVDGDYSTSAGSCTHTARRESTALSADDVVDTSTIDAANEMANYDPTSTLDVA